MAVTKICVAPFDALALAVDPPLALTLSVLFAALAEGLIEADYLAKRPGKIFVDHYFDNPITASYIAFLASHNPHLRTRRNLAALAILANMPGGGISRPDILTDSGGLKEYYEIKPDSAAGSAAGAAKLIAIIGFMGIFTLPYAPGITFTPTPSIPLGSGTIPTVGGPVPFSATLGVARTKAGLIQYKGCVETDFVKVGVTVLVIIAIVIIIILTKRVPIPIPVPGGAPVPVLI